MTMVISGDSTLVNSVDEYLLRCGLGYATSCCAAELRVIL